MFIFRSSGMYRRILSVASNGSTVFEVAPFGEESKKRPKRVLEKCVCKTLRNVRGFSYFIASDFQWRIGKGSSECNF